MSSVDTPVRHPTIRIIRADLWQHMVEFREADETAVDVSDRSFSTWLLEKGADPDTDRIAITVDDGNANVGDLLLTLLPAATTDLVAGRRYTWAFAEQLADGPVTLWRADVTVGDPNA